MTFFCSVALARPPHFVELEERWQLEEGEGEQTLKWERF